MKKLKTEIGSNLSLPKYKLILVVTLVAMLVPSFGIGYIPLAKADGEGCNCCGEDGSTIGNAVHVGDLIIGSR